MRHPTYKHLEARLRLGAFSIGQWAQITITGVVAALFGGYLSPFSASVTIFVCVVVAGLPVALSYGAMGVEFSVTRLAAAGWRYWRQPHRYLPGPGPDRSGYVVHAHDDDRIDDHVTSGVRAEERAALWDV